MSRVADPSGSHTGHDAAAGAAGAYVDPASARAAVSRGRFLTGVTLGLGGLIGAAVTVPVVGFALGPSFSGEAWYWTDLGATDQFSDKFQTVLYERGPNGHSDRRVAFVRKESDTSFLVIANTCMHLGCPVELKGTSFACPCHGGQYDSEGKRTAGPPVRPLNRIETDIKSVPGHLLIGRVFASKEIDGKVVMSDTWKDPGQPVQGLLSFLYPAPPR
jgi:menaquinol-cytochrome c reductase iron-sulfur subunit